MGAEECKKSSVGLTSSEISNIWAVYMKYSMELRFLEYFIETTEDGQIRKIVDSMLNQTRKSMEEVKNQFVSENLVVPKGLTREDIQVNACKVFSDIFILIFCYDLSMLSLSTYPGAFAESTKAEIRNHFQSGIDFNMNIQNEMVKLMLSKGVYIRPPQLAVENVVDFVDEKKYLSGLIGESRPINMPEVANVFRLINRAHFSKMVFVAFSKLAISKDLKKHFSKGRDGIQAVLDSLQEILENENIPIPAASDYNIFEVENSPFSDKLMLYFVNSCLGLFCFTMLCQAMTSSFRSDIVARVAKIMFQMQDYYKDGVKLTIKEGWMEKPPQSIDRKLKY